MKRIPVRLITAALTFVIGVLAASAWLIYRTPAPPLTVCELIRNPGRYTSKTVRVRGVIFGHDEMGLYAPDCGGGASYIHANFGPEPWGQFKSKARPSGTYYFAGEQDEYLVDATLRGRFEKVRNADCGGGGRLLGAHKFPYTIYCYELVVSGVERVEATDVKWLE